MACLTVYTAMVTCREHHTLVYTVFLIIFNCDARIVLNNNSSSNIMNSISYAISRSTADHGALPYNRTSIPETSHLSLGHHTDTSNITHQRVITSSASQSSVTTDATSTGLSAWTETITNVIIMAFLGGVIVKYLKLNKVVREIGTAAHEVIARRQNNQNVDNDEMRRLSIQASAATSPKSTEHVDSETSDQFQPNQEEHTVFSAYRDLSQANVTVRVIADTHACPVEHDTLQQTISDPQDDVSSPQLSIESERFSVEPYQLSLCNDSACLSCRTSQVQQTPLCSSAGSYVCPSSDHDNIQQKHSSQDKLGRNSGIAGPKASKNKLSVHKSPSLCDLDQHLKHQYLTQSSKELSKSHDQMPQKHWPPPPL